MLNCYRLKNLFTICLLLCSSAYASSEPYFPMPANKYVNDFVGILEPTEASELFRQLSSCERRLGIEFTVVIIDSINTYNQGHTSFEAFATNLFNAWGIGDSHKNNGVLLLLALKDRAVRIELGTGYAASYSKAAADVINSTIIPLLKGGNPQEAVVAGAKAMITALEDSSGSSFFLYGFIIAALIALFYMLVTLSNDQSTNTTIDPQEQRKHWYWLSTLRKTHHKRVFKSGGGSGFGGGRSSGGGSSGRW